jgi:hypothetical protein
MNRMSILHTFGIFKRAQAPVGLETSRKHGRRVRRVHSEITRGLAVLKENLKSTFRSQQVML